MLVWFVAVVFVAEQESRRFVFQVHEVDSCVLTKRGSIYEIQWAQNSSQLNVIYVDDQVHVCANVEYKAKKFGFQCLFGIVENVNLLQHFWRRI